MMRALQSCKCVLVLPIHWLTGCQKRQYWLIGGALGDYYDENSAALHQYIRKNYPKQDIYWVVNPSAKCVEQIREIGPVVYRHTLKTNLMALRAQALICTHSISGDICRYSKYFLKGVSVYLDHGVRGFKENPSSNRYDFDIVEASGKREKIFKKNWVGTSGEYIYITGLPMQDSLLHKQKVYKTDAPKRILYMPTWRSWLMTRRQLAFASVGAFSSSEYFRAIQDFLGSKRLRDFLTENGLILDCVLHRNVHLFHDAFKDIFTSERINLADKNINVQDYLVSHDLLITDYSSVCWDFLLLNKPIIFYQFDQGKFIEFQKPLIDYNQDLFGPAVFNVDELMREMEKAANNDFKFDTVKYQNIKKDFLEYADGNSCERLTNLIFEKINRLE